MCIDMDPNTMEPSAYHWYHLVSAYPDVRTASISKSSLCIQIISFELDNFTFSFKHLYNLRAYINYKKYPYNFSYIYVNLEMQCVAYFILGCYANLWAWPRQPYWNYTFTFPCKKIDIHRFSHEFGKKKNEWGKGFDKKCYRRFIIMVSTENLNLNSCLTNKY